MGSQSWLQPPFQAASDRAKAQAGRLKGGCSQDWLPHHYCNTSLLSHNGTFETEPKGELQNTRIAQGAADPHEVAGILARTGKIQVHAIE